MDRTTVKRGPAVISFAGATFHPRSEVRLDLMRDTFDVETSTLAARDPRISNVQHKISFTPDGAVSAEILEVLYACQGYTLGASLFGADSAVVVTWKNDGETMTFPAGAITRPPDLTISAVAPLFGETELTCLGKNNTAWTDTAKFMTVGTATYTEAADLGAILTESPTVAWGSTSPWNSIKTLDGVKIGFEMQSEPDSEDAGGIFDYIFQGLKVTATFTPRGITATQLITAAKVQGSGVARGMSLNNTSLGPLNVSNSGFYLRLYGAALTKYPLQGGRQVMNRVGEVSLVNTPSDSSDTIVYISTAAPVEP